MEDTEDGKNYKENYIIDQSIKAGSYVTKGDSITLSVPNITGKIANIQGRNYSSIGEYQSGSLYWNDTTDNTNQESIENNSYSTAITGRGIMLDAKKSNSIYGKSDTVRPKNIGVAMYIKL